MPLYQNVCHKFNHPNYKDTIEYDQILNIQHQLVLLILYFVFIFQPSEAQVQIRKGDMRVTKMMIMVLGFYFASYVPHVLILAFIGKLEYEPVGIIILERVRF